jgi:hypothetical protein
VDLEQGIGTGLFAFGLICLLITILVAVFRESTTAGLICLFFIFTIAGYRLATYR